MELKNEIYSGFSTGFPYYALLNEHCMAAIQLVVGRKPILKKTPVFRTWNSKISREKTGTENPRFSTADHIAGFRMSNGGPRANWYCLQDIYRKKTPQKFIELQNTRHKKSAWKYRMRLPSFSAKLSNCTLFIEQWMGAVQPIFFDKNDFEKEDANRNFSESKLQVKKFLVNSKKLHIS